jgi:hypothetical protein
MDRLKILASLKKILLLLFIGSISLMVNGILYFVVLSGVIRGVLRVISLSFYVYFTVMARI